MQALYYYLDKADHEYPMLLVLSPFGLPTSLCLSHRSTLSMSSIISLALKYLIAFSYYSNEANISS
jgi:hypothetical protein